MSNKQLKLWIALARGRGQPTKVFREAIGKRWPERLILSPPKEDK